MGCLGDTGTGKSYACRAIVAAYLARSQGIVLVHNPKGEAWEGEHYTSMDELARRPPQGRLVVFSPVGIDALDLSPETMAALQWRLVARRCPSLGVYDELGRACGQPGRWAIKGGGHLARCFTEGRSREISVLWGSQTPQGCPREAFEESSSILCFRLAGRALICLDERDYLEGGAVDVLPRLPGDEVPPAERGMFLLLRRGRAWDRKPYRL